MAAVNDYVKVDRSKQLGNNLVNLSEQIASVRQLTNLLYSISQHQFSGSDYTTLESNFGLTAGNGAIVAGVLSTLNDIFNTGNAVTDATRLASLDGFVNRLAKQ